MKKFVNLEYMLFFFFNNIDSYFLFYVRNVGKLFFFKCDKDYFNNLIKNRLVYLINNNKLVA